MARRRRTTSRAVVVRNVAVSRSRSYSRSRGGVFGGRKIPVAVLAGFIPATAWAIDAGRQGNWGAAGERLLASFTGYEWGQKKFTFMYLNKGLYPVLAGMVLHGVANYLGINRYLGKLRLPVEV